VDRRAKPAHPLHAQAQLGLTGSTRPPVRPAGDPAGNRPARGTKARAESASRASTGSSAAQLAEDRGTRDQLHHRGSEADPGDRTHPLRPAGLVPHHRLVPLWTPGRQTNALTIPRTNAYSVKNIPQNNPHTNRIDKPRSPAITNREASRSRSLPLREHHNPRNRRIFTTRNNTGKSFLKSRRKQRSHPQPDPDPATQIPPATQNPRSEPPAAARGTRPGPAGGAPPGRRPPRPASRSTPPSAVSKPPHAPPRPGLADAATPAPTTRTPSGSCSRCGPTGGPGRAPRPRPRRPGPQTHPAAGNLAELDEHPDLLPGVPGPTPDPATRAHLVRSAATPFSCG